MAPISTPHGCPGSGSGWSTVRAGALRVPWRADRDPYRVLVSEMMLVQTTVAAVVPFFERFRRGSRRSRLAEADEVEVLKLWEGLGYYRRAGGLHAAARAVVRDHGGAFPDDLEAIRPCRGSAGTSRGRSSRSPSIARADRRGQHPARPGTLAGLARGLEKSRDAGRGSGRPLEDWSPPGGRRVQPGIHGAWAPGLHAAPRGAWSARSPRNAARPWVSRMTCPSPRPGRCLWPWPSRARRGRPPRPDPDRPARPGPTLGALLGVRRSIGPCRPGRPVLGEPVNLAEGVRRLTGVRVTVGPILRTLRFSVTKHRVELEAHEAVGLSDRPEPGPGAGPGHLGIARRNLRELSFRGRRAVRPAAGGRTARAGGGDPEHGG